MVKTVQENHNIDLIIGLYDNYCGNIYYNDKRYKSINTEIIVKNLLSICEQKIDNLPFLFVDTTDIDLEWFRQLIIDFNLKNYIILEDNVIDINKQKINEFSTGEIQKLLLCWTISKKKSDILILDEPTSALDNFAKEKVIRLY